MNGPSLTITVVLCLSILAIPRKWFILPYIVAACLIPMDQRAIIVGLDFTALRFCVLAGFMRLYVRNEIRPIRLNRIDKLVFAWMLTGALIFIIQWLEMGAFINRCGYLFDGLGLYWLFRQAIRNWHDVLEVFFCFGLLAIVSAPLILLERISKSSPYSFMGHIPARFYQGRFRCSGPFPHFIMMGLFWASLLPWFYGCIRANLSRIFYFVASAAALLCTVLSASSTPLLTVCFIGMFLLIYRFRRYGKQMALGTIAVLIGLHFSMNNPVWHLMARVNVFSGSTGWHRFQLFDEFINRVTEWFLLGTQSTAHWGDGLEDVTNQYVLEGVRGGIVTLCIFVTLIVLCVIVTGRASLLFESKKLSWLCWGICVSVLGHAVSFWGVSYFGQIIMLLYLVFTIVAFTEDQVQLLQLNKANQRRKTGATSKSSPPGSAHPRSAYAG